MGQELSSLPPASSRATVRAGHSQPVESLSTLRHVDELTSSRSGPKGLSFDLEALDRQVVRLECWKMMDFVVSSVERIMDSRKMG
jgi:hypothetical protein